MELLNLGRFRLVAGGGFEPHVPIDSTQVIDSAIREIGAIREKGDSFLHFSYTLPLSANPLASVAFRRYCLPVSQVFPGALRQF